MWARFAHWHRLLFVTSWWCIPVLPRQEFKRKSSPEGKTCSRGLQWDTLQQLTTFQEVVSTASDDAYYSLDPALCWPREHRAAPTADDTSLSWGCSDSSKVGAEGLRGIAQSSASASEDRLSPVLGAFREPRMQEEILCMSSNSN